MINAKRILLTKTGLEDLKKEYEELVKTRRPVAVKRLTIARDLGDLSENSEYAAALEDLSFIDGRIAELKDLLLNAKAVVHTSKDNGEIDVGCKVTVHLNGKKDIFMIVGEWEANPLQKKISHSSPLGQALLGKKVGEKVEVEAPVGKLIYTIIEIE